MTKGCDVIKKLSILKFQFIYSGLLFIVFYVGKYKSFSVLEGIKSTVLVLCMSVFLKSIPSLMLKVYKNPAYGIKTDKLKLIKLVLGILKSTLLGLFIFTICLSILSIVGILVSDVPITTAYVFVLLVPMWLTIREEIKDLIVYIDNNEEL